MPVVLEEPDFEPWLSGSVGAELFEPGPEMALTRWPVSRRINKIGDDDDETLIEKVAL
jgi:putative SOS response-associated peptidase YedK